MKKTENSTRKRAGKTKEEYEDLEIVKRFEAHNNKLKNMYKNQDNQE